ncbi:MAG: glycoside-pentoside-hexuronide (GPH):cation symporter [Promicromonosporaceae bacterium]|nr:glycoside-pentoside-hexuronide (GPH):cation symporter [Promicromonosporaceae bacterium]
MTSVAVPEMSAAFRKNRWTFGLGTIGRDMVYTLVSMFLIVYLTQIDISNRDLGIITGIIVAFRVLDAVTDPLIGMLVDNTRTRWGKHKPWILFGALLSGGMTLLLFHDPRLTWPGMSSAMLVTYFTIVFFFWSTTYALNDIAYWSYVPELSSDQKERESIGSKARIFSLVGLFFVVAANEPIRNMFATRFGGQQQAWFWFAMITVVVLWIFQAVTLFGVTEPEVAAEDQSHTTFRQFLNAIVKNDQLLFIAIAMALFMIGYTTTTSFGLFYFQFVYGDGNMFSIFAIVLGVSQVLSLMAVPHVAKRLPRKTIYLIATILVVLGYVIFYFAPTTTMLFIGISGVIIFVGQAAIQLLMLMFLADTVDYGQWKLGRRNDSVTFSLQPFINKAGGAIATGVVGATAIWVGLNGRAEGDLLNSQEAFIFKMAMFAFPLLCILVGFLIYRSKYRIDEQFFAQIRSDLDARAGGVPNAESEHTDIDATLAASTLNLPDPGPM